MNKGKKIVIKNMDGVMEEMELVNSFGINDDINKKFVILSRGEVNPDGLAKIYVSEVIEDPVGSGTFKMIGIADESMWEKVKIAMKQIVEGGK